MSVTCQQIIEELEKLAPPNLAEAWDSVGLMVGNPSQEIKKVWTTLDVTLSFVEAAAHEQVDLIVSHHPLIFKAIKQLDTSTTAGKIIEQLMKANIAVFSAHTNLDRTVGGVNDVLAHTLKLQDVRPLTVDFTEKLVKLVVFVPATHEQAVYEAVMAAGAGHIGQYSHCAFVTTGTGTFLPLADTHPFIGQQGLLTSVDEVRLETILPEAILPPVLTAMLAAHPYEEVAYDIYPLKNQGKATGLGRIGKIEPVSLQDFIFDVKKQLNINAVNAVGRPEQRIGKVAVCGGSGASLMLQAKASGADVLVTGDVKYHDALEAAALGIAVIDAGHYATEQPVVAVLASYLQEHFPLLAVDTNHFQRNVLKYY
jgi:dinuclear metal center YbgI/SA1388 family protein